MDFKDFNIKFSTTPLLLAENPIPQKDIAEYESDPNLRMPPPHVRAVAPWAYDSLLVQRMIASLKPKEPEPISTIKIFRDLDNPYGGHLAFKGGQTREFEVHLPRHVPLDFNLLATLAHELGHMLGQLLNAPATREDFRGKAGAQAWLRTFGEPAGYNQACFKSEVEAWEFAKQIMDYWFRMERDESLRGYWDRSEIERIKEARDNDSTMAWEPHPYPRAYGGYIFPAQKEESK